MQNLREIGTTRMYPVAGEGAYASIVAITGFKKNQDREPWSRRKVLESDPGPSDPGRKEKAGPALEGKPGLGEVVVMGVGFDSGAETAQQEQGTGATQEQHGGARFGNTCRIHQRIHVERVFRNVEDEGSEGQDGEVGDDGDAGAPGGDSGEADRS